MIMFEDELAREDSYTSGPQGSTHGTLYSQTSNAGSATLHLKLYSHF